MDLTAYVYWAEDKQRFFTYVSSPEGITFVMPNGSDRASEAFNAVVKYVEANLYGTNAKKAHERALDAFAEFLKGKCGDAKGADIMLEFSLKYGQDLLKKLS